MPSTFITNEAELRRVIKRPHSAVLAKIESGPLKSSPLEFLATARLALVTTVANDGSPRLLACGGAPGFVSQDAGGRLRVPVHVDRRSEVVDNLAEQPWAAMLLMTPGVRHSFRVYGSASMVDDGAVLEIAPRKSYAHCAKALIRSELWKPTADLGNRESATGDLAQTDRLDDSCAEFIRSSPFVALGTSLEDGEADASPRGDPPGFVQVVDDHTLFVPERPGNRIADSLRNILDYPRAALLCLVPGDERTLEIVGHARITTDEKLCHSATVNAKAPKLGIVIDVHAVDFRTEPALAAARIWEPATHVDETDLSTLGALVADPDQTSTLPKRLRATATDRLVNLDYKRTLY